MGTASGTTSGSESSSSAPITPPREGKIIRIAMIINTRPPPIETASRDRLSAFSSAGPENKKPNIITKAISNSRARTFSRLDSGTFFNTDKNTGILPSGSMIKKSVIATAQVSIKLTHKKRRQLAPKECIHYEEALQIGRDRPFAYD